MIEVAKLTDMRSHARAVLDGFQRPSEQTARYLLLLVAEIELRDRLEAAKAFSKASKANIDVPGPFK